MTEPNEDRYFTLGEIADHLNLDVTPSRLRQVVSRLRMWGYLRKPERDKREVFLDQRREFDKHCVEVIDLYYHYVRTGAIKPRDNMWRKGWAGSMLMTVANMGWHWDEPTWDDAVVLQPRKGLTSYRAS